MYLWEIEVEMEELEAAVADLNFVERKMQENKIKEP